MVVLQAAQCAIMIPWVVDRCAGCATLAAAALGNKRLACVAVAEVGVLPSGTCIIIEDH